MTTVVSVRFNNKGKIYFFDPGALTVSNGEAVIVETAKGIEFAECIYGNHEVEDTSVVQPLRPVIRVATTADKKRADENKEKETEAFNICQEKIIKHEMDMKLVDVEYNFEGNKILFFFTSDGRVDFRDLVKDLASVFKTRIELRQIGVRDEARMLGGLGICGKPFCCSQFLDEFQPVSIKMAKTQGLSLNPTKISGTCGRLMCCLKYEQHAYEDLVKNAPKNDAFVDTPMGKGSVMSVNLLRGNAKIRLEDANDTTLRTFSFDELDVLGGKARRSEYLTARAEGRLEEAGFSESRFQAELVSSYSGQSAGNDKAQPARHAPPAAPIEQQTDGGEQTPGKPRKPTNRRRRRGGGKGGNPDAKPKQQVGGAVKPPDRPAKQSGGAAKQPDRPAKPNQPAGGSNNAPKPFAAKGGGKFSSSKPRFGKPGGRKPGGRKPGGPKPAHPS